MIMVDDDRYSWEKQAFYHCKSYFKWLECEKPQKEPSNRGTKDSSHHGRGPHYGLLQPPWLARGGGCFGLPYFFFCCFFLIRLKPWCLVCYVRVGSFWVSLASFINPQGLKISFYLHVLGLQSQILQIHTKQAKPYLIEEVEA